VKIFSGLRVSAGIDDGQQGAPLVQRDLRVMVIYLSN